MCPPQSMPLSLAPILRVHMLQQGRSCGAHAICCSTRLGRPRSARLAAHRIPAGADARQGADTPGDACMHCCMAHASLRAERAGCASARNRRREVRCATGGGPGGRARAHSLRSMEAGMGKPVSLLAMAAIWSYWSWPPWKLLPVLCWKWPISLESCARARAPRASGPCPQARAHACELTERPEKKRPSAGGARCWGWRPTAAAARRPCMAAAQSCPVSAVSTGARVPCSHRQLWLVPSERPAAR